MSDHKEPTVFSITVDDSEVTFFGHHHVYKHTYPYIDELDELMDDNDQMAWEYVSYKDYFEPGETTSDDISETMEDLPQFQEYFDLVEEKALDHFDEIYGPDASAGELERKARAYYMITPILATIGLGVYYFGKAASSLMDSANYNISGRSVEGNGESKKISRRDLLRKGGLGAGTLWTGSCLYSSDIQETTMDALGLDSEGGSVLPLTWTDNREVFSAEGINKIIEQNPGDDILCLWGDVHPESIAEYLENPDERRAKIEFYEDIMLDREENMAKWNKKNDEWLLTDLIDLTEN